MLELIRNFLRNRKGNLIENIIYIIIIGALSYTFYTEKVQQPMNANMDTINEKISEWTEIKTSP
jgi:hypothetical protein